MGEKAHKSLVEYKFRCKKCGEEMRSMKPDWKHCVSCGGELERI